MKIKLLFCLMVCQSAMLFGMELDKSGNNDVVEWKITIIPNVDDMRYIGLLPPTFEKDATRCEKTFLEKVFDTTLEKGDPLVPVRIFKDKNNERIFLKIPQIPGHYRKYYGKEICRVPLSFIDNKEEGEKFILRLYNNFTVTLKCDQSASRMFNKKKFEVYLKELKKQFANNPNWLAGDEKKLLSEGILVRTEDPNVLVGYKNGPNSYIIQRYASVGKPMDN